MSVQVGIDMYLYRNTATFGSPTWVIIENVRDLTAPDAFGEADVSRRMTGQTALKQTEPTLREFEAEWDMVRDEGDADFLALRTAFAARTLTEFAFASGAIATTGTVYYRVETKLFEFSRNEALEDANSYHVKALPCFSSNASGITTVP